MTTVSQVMTRECVWTAPGSNVSDVARLMNERCIGFVPVGENDRLIGCITDRDIITRTVATNRNPATVTARDVMTTRVLYCYEDQDVNETVRSMASCGVRRFPVVDRNKRLVGTVSFADLAAFATPDVYTRAEAQMSYQRAEGSPRRSNAAA